jgi:hypothetical protein
MLKKILLPAAVIASVGLSTLLSDAAYARPYPYAPAPWHAGWNYAAGYWRAGWGPRPGVFAAGVLGVAVGASLTAPYYGPPPPYFAGPGYWGYWNGCRSYWAWSPALRAYVPAAVCY